MAGNKNKRIGVVYSTNADFQYQYEEEIPQATLAPSKQRLMVCLDRKQRKGKQVTLVKGFVGKREDLAELGRMLKTKCGAGGGEKDGEIILQGDFREKVLLLLRSIGYQVKQSGS